MSNQSRRSNNKIERSLHITDLPPFSFIPSSCSSPSITVCSSSRYNQLYDIDGWLPYLPVIFAVAVTLKLLWTPVILRILRCFGCCVGRGSADTRKDPEHVV